MARCKRFSRLSHESSSAPPLSPIEVTVFIEHLRLLHVDDVSSTLSLSFSLCSYWTSKRYTKEEISPRIPGLSIDKMTEEKRSVERLDKLQDDRMRQCHSAVVTVLCSQFDMSAYPKDSHICDLSLMSTSNASETILLPHLHTAEDTTLGNGEWVMVHTKTYVQWITVEYEDFEMIVVSFIISRNSYTLEVVQWSAFLLNVLLIFMAFPANSLSEAKNLTSAHLMLVPVLQIALWAAVAIHSPSLAELPLIVRRVSYFAVLSLLVSLTGHFAPFFTVALRCVPYNAHPCPIDFPTPNELLSLDSERARYSSVLDSARIDSSLSPRNVNMELCMAQVRYTLSAVNEFLSIAASAKWHRRQWAEGFARIEIILLVLFQSLNFMLFLICSNN